MRYLALFTLAGIASASAFGIVVACGDPYDGASATADGAADTAADIAADTDAASNDATTFDASEPDSPPPIDASGEKPDIDAAGCLCDCDDDGFRSASQDAAACNGSVATQTDCDDLDPRAHPDAGFVEQAPTAATQGDWNCDTLVNRELPVNVNCGALTFSNCAGASGFTGDPGCGTSASYVTCKTNLATCVVDTTTTRTQGCR